MDIRRQLELLADLPDSPRISGEFVSDVARAALVQLRRGDMLASAMVEYVRSMDAAGHTLKARLADIDGKFPPGA